MNIYVDLEFTGLKKDTSIISIGMVDENGRSVYVEYTDYNKEDINDWIQQNVINKCLFDHNKDLQPTITTIDNNTIGVGDKEFNRQTLLDWLSKYKDIQFISDVCHYDMVLLVDALYNDALSIPSNVSAVCYDINHDIARYFKITPKEAFNKSRETIVKEELKSLVDIKKHNSLYDAKVIKLIYEKLNK